MSQKRMGTFLLQNLGFLVNIKTLNSIWPKFHFRIFNRNFISEIIISLICDCRFAISAKHEFIGPILVPKHPLVSRLMTGIFNNRTLQRKHCFIWNVERVLSSLNSLDTDKLKLKMRTLKVTILQVLAGSSGAQDAINSLSVSMFDHLVGFALIGLRYSSFNSTCFGIYCTFQIFKF